MCLGVYTGVEEGVTYKTFDEEEEMAAIVALIDKDLSEPYSVLTYRYFVYNWSQHTHMAMYQGKCCGVVVSTFFEWIFIFWLSVFQVLCCGSA